MKERTPKVVWYILLILGIVLYVQAPHLSSQWTFIDGIVYALLTKVIVDFLCSLPKWRKKRKQRILREKYGR